MQIDEILFFHINTCMDYLFLDPGISFAKAENLKSCCYFFSDFWSWIQTHFDLNFVTVCFFLIAVINFLFSGKHMLSLFCFFFSLILKDVLLFTSHMNNWDNAPIFNEILNIDFHSYFLLLFSYKILRTNERSIYKRKRLLRLVS